MMGDTRQDWLLTDTLPGDHTLSEMGFVPLKADPDVWMHPSQDGDCYEYIAVYVDDLAIATKDPAEICQTLRQTYNFKLKGNAPLEYHLGCAYK